jgi:hypothetical protein
MYNQCEKYKQRVFRRNFYRVKTKFLTFFFLRLKLYRICNKKQKEKNRKNFVLVVKNVVMKKKFLPSPIFTAIFFGGEQFSPKVKSYSKRPIST